MLSVKKTNVYFIISAKKCYFNSIYLAYIREKDCRQLVVLFQGAFLTLKSYQIYTYMHVQNIKIALPQFCLYIYYLCEIIYFLI